MREILFKAKRKDNGEWVEGFLIKDLHEEEWYIGFLFGGGAHDTDVAQINLETICQYTGLTDKNGNKIWENDVLMFHSNKNELAKACYGEFYVVDVVTLEKIDTVIGWHYEVIETDAISKCEPFNISMPLTNDYIKTCELEVIGNIFDNKDLIGE